MASHFSSDVFLPAMGNCFQKREYIKSASYIVSNIFKAACLPLMNAASTVPGYSPSNNPSPAKKTVLMSDLFRISRAALDAGVA